jgi:SAM-dependent methyltransferase
MTELPHSAPAERNKQPILEVLRQVLPAQGRALEIASGTGQHVVWFAAGLPQWSWQPSDAQATQAQTDSLATVAARLAQAGLSNVQPPIFLDVMTPQWFSEATQFDAIYCANMLHIAPWAACAALMQGSARHLAPGGVLVTYGPYLEDEVATSSGNLEFDQSLRERNPAWGIRRREDVEQQARLAGLRLLQRHAMPANNLLLVWSRA